MAYHDPKKPSEQTLLDVTRLKIIIPERGIVLNRSDNTECRGINDRGYCIIGILHKPIKRCHLIWWAAKGEWPLQEIDHKDLDHLNDKIGNLKPSTRIEQAQNTSVVLSRSLPIGVYKRKDPTMTEEHYIVQIRLQGKTVTMKYFHLDQLNEAARLSQLALEMRRVNPDVTKGEIMSIFNRGTEV